MAPAADRPPGETRVRGAWRRRAAAGALLALAVAALVGVGSWLGSESALQRVARWAADATEGRLTIEAARGSLLGRVEAGRVLWHDPGSVTVAIDAPVLELDPWALLRSRIGLRTVHAARIEVLLAESDEPARSPPSLALPIGLEVGELTVGEIVVRRVGDNEPLRLTDARASLRHGRSGWTVDTASVVGPFGVLDVSGRIGAAPPFELSGRARLDAVLGNEPLVVGATFAGDLEALTVDLRTIAHGSGISLQLRAAPFAAQPVAGGVLTVSGLDLARVDRAWPSTRLSGAVEASAPTDQPVADGAWPPLAGTVRAGNAAAGRIDAGRVPLDTAAARWRIEAGALVLEGIDAVGPAGRLTGEARIRLPGGADGAPFALALATDALDLAQVHGALPRTGLHGRAGAVPDGDALRLDVDLADAGLTGSELRLVGRGRLTASVFELAEARLAAGEATVTGAGRVAVAAPHRFDLRAQLVAVDPARFVADAPAGRLTGTVQADGQLGGRWSVQAAIALQDSRLDRWPLAGRLAGRIEPGRWSGLDGQLALGAARLSVRGDLGLPGNRLVAVLTVPRLDEFAAPLSGQAALDVALRGPMRAPGVEATLRARGLRLDDRWQAGTLAATVRTDSLDAVRAALAAVGVTLTSPDGLPGSGPIVADAVRVPIAASIEAGALRLAGQSVDTLAARLEGSDAQHRLTIGARSRALKLDARLLAEGGLVFKPGADGVADAAPVDAVIWRGRVLEASNEVAPTVRLLAAVPLAVGPGSLTLGSLAARVDGDDGAQLRIERASVTPERVAIAGDASGVPLRWLEGFVAERGVRWRAPDALRLGARFDLVGPPGAAFPAGWQGWLEVARESGDLILDLTNPDGAVEQVRAGLQALQARVDLADGRLRAQAELRGDKLGSVRADAQFAVTTAGEPARLDAAVPLAGRIDLDAPSLAFARVLAGDAWRFDGTLRARLALSGTLGRPAITGPVTGEGLVAEQREFGMRLTDGVLDASFENDYIDLRSLRFSSGRGSVRMSGALRADERSDAVLVLDRMPIPIGAGQRLVLSGQARAALDRGLLTLNGALRADEGLIEITAAGTVRPPDDVVVVRTTAEAGARIAAALARRADRAAARARGDAHAGAAARPGAAAGDGAPTAAVDPRGFRVRANLTIDLGDNLRVFGNGLDSRLAGQLTLSGQVPDAMRLNGTVRTVGGTFTGFGQRLEIETGRLVFSGPVDDPAIEIVAYRRFLPVEAGVKLTGTARQPRLSLVSRPDVPDADKLSWLVLGTGADTARGGGETAALQAAAATLLATADPSLSSAGFASTLGFDVLSIRTGQVGAVGDASSSSASQSAQDTVVTVGKRLTDRLLVTYEQSLRGLQNLLRLQYEVSERLLTRVGVGTRNTVDVLWTHRYD
jgi:translocation and assembly module TamB